VPITIPEPPPPQRDIPLSEVLENIAALQVYHMPFVAMENGNKDTDWKSIPPLLRREDVRISLPQHGWRGLADGIAMSAGYALLACNFNSGGNWKHERWDKNDFEANGWHELDHEELGGRLVNDDQREQVIFWKKVRAGETGTLHCNKSPPTSSPAVPMAPSSTAP